MFNKEIKVLDYGYVQFIEAYGCGLSGNAGSKDKGNYHQYEHTDFEVGIIEAARQSTQGSFRGWETDAKLLRFLYEHKHSTPFEFSGMVLEIKAPIFVFREWHRHRTQSYNEMSARYAPLPNENYVPSIERLMISNDKNKQAGSVGNKVLSYEDAENFKDRLIATYNNLDSLYNKALEDGVPKELARVLLPVGRYSKMRASANLRNWIAFLTLRMHPDAQWEIRQYANAVCDIMCEIFPQTMELFKKESE